MPVITANLLGRFGNQCMGYLFARGYATKHGFDFQCEPWIGQRIFQLEDAPITAKDLPRRSELDLVDGEGDVNIYGYAQSQNALTYTRQQAREWFKFRPEIDEKLKPYRDCTFETLAHRRVGDYIGYGYPVVSKKSYLDAYREFDLFPPDFVTEEDPLTDENFTGELSFLPDFYTLVRAKVIMRANSTFSWIAGVLNEGRVFSPIIDGLEGGREHDVKFVEGNWPRLSNHSFCTDLHLPEQ